MHKKYTTHLALQTSNFVRQCKKRFCRVSGFYLKWSCLKEIGHKREQFRAGFGIAAMVVLIQHGNLMERELEVGGEGS